MKRNRLFVIGMAVFFGWVLARPAAAQTVTFASYQYQSGSFDYFADGSFSATIIGTFSYANLNNLPVGLRPPPTDPPFTAVIQIDGARTGDAADIGGSFVSQPVSANFSITKVGAPFAGGNLLSGSVTGTIFGKASSGSLFGRLTSGNTISYNSDFVSFADSIDRDFSFTLNSVTPGLSFAGANLAPFSATNTGIFGNKIAVSGDVPEPGLFATFCGMGVCGVLLLKRRYRKG